MAQNDPVVNRIRIIPRKDDFLDRNVGASGEIYYSSDVDTLRLYSGNDKGGFEVVTQNNIRRNTAFEEVASIKYTVTVDNQSDTANRYVLNGYYHTKVTMMRGYTYVFDQSDQTNVYYPNAEGTTINAHPLLFSTTADGSHATPIAGTPYETGVIYLIENLPVTRAQYISKFSAATSRKVQITVTVDTPDDLHYYCQYHSGMGNEITVSYPGTGTGGASITVSDTAPEEPTNGNLWYKSDDGRLLVYVTDTDSSQWVQPSVPIADTNSGVGNFQLSASTIDTDDSSGISIVPSVTMNSDLIIENNLTVSGYRLPNSDGVNGQVLSTNGSGTLSFTTPIQQSAIDAKADTQSPTFTGQIKVNTVFANGTVYNAPGSSTTTLNLLAAPQISYINGPTANLTFNLTNVPSANGDITQVNFVITQGGTAFIIDTIQIGGNEQTIEWEGGSAPTGTNNGVDDFEFKIVRYNDSWIVIGKMTGHG